MKRLSLPLSLRQIGLLCAVIVIAVDQITKNLVVALMYEGHHEILPFFNLVHVWNRGISFGMFNHDHSGAWILAAVALAITAAFTVWLWKADNKGMAIAIGAVIGGALGNVIDRIRFQAVVDFLDFHAFGWHYPAFNIADSAVVLGIAYIILDGLFWEPKRKQQAENHQHV
ncbi:MAG: signal peptidase II [Micavibrio sp.]